MDKEVNKKARAWTIVVYPDSAPKNWREIIDELHIAWIESPLHDKDITPDGEIKKSHWHILLLFDGPTTYKNVKSISNLINSPIPQAIASSRGMVRYMIHMDNPEKYQYAKADIIGHGGADVDSFFEMTTTNRIQVLKDITLFVKKTHITSFADLTYYAIEYSDDWFDVLANHNTLFLNKLIDSEWQKKSK